MTAPMPSRISGPGQTVLSFRWMMAPAVAFVGLMIVFPILYAIWISLRENSLGMDDRFVGLANYIELLSDGEFHNAFILTWVLYGLALAMQMVIGTWLGFTLNRVRSARNLVRTVAVMPFMMPPVVVGMMAIVILDPAVGVANWLLGQVGIGPSLWLADPKWVLLTVAAVDTWQWSPLIGLLVLGGLQSLPTKVFEAAEIDGVIGWKRLVHITLPLLAPTLLSAAILRSVDLLRFFDVIYITTRGGPGNASTTLNIYAYQQGFEFSRFGYASAGMITLAAVVMVTVVAFSRLRQAVTW